MCEVVTVTFEILCDKKLSENSVERDIQLRIMKIVFEVVFIFYSFLFFKPNELITKHEPKHNI